jgi:hypothetical protein
MSKTHFCSNFNDSNFVFSVFIREHLFIESEHKTLGMIIYSTHVLKRLENTWSNDSKNVDIQLSVNEAFLE